MLPFRLNILIYLFISFTSTACTHLNQADKNSIQIQCDNQQANITFNDKEAELSMNEMSYKLQRTVSASGEKYQNSTALVWLKANNALIKVNGVYLRAPLLIHELAS